MSDEHKIKPFASDDNLKALGELLTNDTSRKIMSHIMNNAMYKNEISTKLDIRISLVIHHINKMEELGIVEITEKKIKRKGEKHKFFKIDSDFFVTLKNTKEEVEEKGLLKRIFKETIKFGAIGIAGGFIWLTDILNYGSSSPVLPVPFSVTAPVVNNTITLSLLVIIIGLIIERVFVEIRKKKKNG